VVLALRRWMVVLLLMVVLQPRVPALLRRRADGVPHVLVLLLLLLLRRPRAAALVPVLQLSGADDSVLLLLLLLPTHAIGPAAVRTAVLPPADDASVGTAEGILIAAEAAHAHRGVHAVLRNASASASASSADVVRAELGVFAVVTRREGGGECRIDGPCRGLRRGLA